MFYLQNHLARPCHVIWPNFSVFSTSLLNILTRILLDTLTSINIQKSRVSCNPGWPQTHSAAKDDLELLLILLPSAAELRAETPYPVYVVVEIDPEASCTLCKCYQISYIPSSSFYSILCKF